MISPYYNCGTYSTTNSVHFDRVVYSSADLWYKSLSLVGDVFFSHQLHNDDVLPASIISIKNNTTGSHPI